MTRAEYKKYQFKESMSLIKYCFTLAVLVVLIVWAPNQAAQFTGYLGAFVLGSSKLKSLVGL